MPSPRLILLGMSAVSLAAMPVPVHAKMKAKFVGAGTYSPTDGCAKLDKMAKGELSPNVANTPLTLTVDGTRTWEGGCNFVSIRKAKPNVWVAKMECSEGAEEWKETSTFKRIDASNIELSTDGKGLTYTLCGEAKEK